MTQMSRITLCMSAKVACILRWMMIWSTSLQFGQLYGVNISEGQSPGGAKPGFSGSHGDLLAYILCTYPVISITGNNFMVFWALERKTYGQLFDL